MRLRQHMHTASFVLPIAIAHVASAAVCGDLTGCVPVALQTQ